MPSLGKLGSANLAAATETLICTVDEASIVNVLLANRNSSETQIRISIGTGVSPALADYIEYDVPLEPNQPMERTGLALSAGEKIWVRSTLANVSARAHGVPAQ